MADLVAPSEPGSFEGHRNPNADRDADHYGPGAGGKKRKVPAFTPSGRNAAGEDMGDGEGDDLIDDEGRDDRDGDASRSKSQPQLFPLRYRTPRTKAAVACSFRKALFLRRKAALITLYIDAQNAVIAGSAKLGPNGKSPLMDVPSFEKLMPSLEDLGMGDWPPDRPGWRTSWVIDEGNGNGDGQMGKGTNVNATVGKVKTLEQWKTKFDQRQKVERARKPMARGGWFPEGSFEYEQENSASKAMRARAKDRAALHKLIVDLRAVALTAKPPPKPTTVTTNGDKPPTKSQRTTTAPAKKVPVAEQEPAQPASIPLSKTASKESDPASSGKTKTKKKKKKRSVLANQGNPHHVDNYRSSRKALNTTDPYEPWPHHEFLLFPPPMRMLATRPQRKTAPLPGAAPGPQPTRAGEDEFICTFCEIDLFFSTEKARRRAIRRLKAERKRKENIRSKAKDVADGKGTLKDDESDFDDDYSCGDDDGTGRCTCGRQISEPHRSVKSRLKPPETDPPDGENHHYHHDHDHDHEHGCGHNHDHDHDHDHHDHDHHHDDHDHHDEDAYGHDHDHGYDHDHDHDHHDHSHDHDHDHHDSGPHSRSQPAPDVRLHYEPNPSPFVDTPEYRAAIAAGVAQARHNQAQNAQHNQPPQNAQRGQSAINPRAPNSHGSLANGANGMSGDNANGVHGRATPEPVEYLHDDLD